MDSDIAQAVVPYVTAAIHAYGTRTLEKLRDAAVDYGSDASINLGRKLLLRLLGHKASQPAVEAAVEDLASEPRDSDAIASLRRAIRRALANDLELQADIKYILDEAKPSSIQQNGGPVQLSQHAAAFGNSRQATLGTGVQNNTFGRE